MRTTLYPKIPSSRVTFLSRFTFVSILLRQNVLWVFGKWLLLQIRHPCQKHPSTNTATLYFGKTKSGCPTNLELRRHPVIPYSRNNATSLSPVLLFPFERILDIISERFFFDTVSIFTISYEKQQIAASNRGFDCYRNILSVLSRIREQCKFRRFACRPFLRHR